MPVAAPAPGPTQYGPVSTPLAARHYGQAKRGRRPELKAKARHATDRGWERYLCELHRRVGSYVGE